MSAERVYRRLLFALPADFRDEAAEELLDTFRQSHARVASRGLVARAGFWCRIVADLVVTSGAERMQRAGRDPIIHCATSRLGTQHSQVIAGYATVNGIPNSMLAGR